MPSRPPKVCTRCGQTYPPTEKRCPHHKPTPYQRHNQPLDTDGYDGEHRTRFRPGVLARDPICVICGIMPSRVADHYPDGRNDLIRMGLDPNDPQYGRGLCKRCDSKQTAQRQPGGWNRRKPPDPPPY